MAEPVTTLTDLLLALLAWWCAWSLRQSGTKFELSRRLWAYGLALQGSGALLGGIYHGFLPHLDPALASPLWHLTLFILGTASSAFVSGLGVAVLTPKVSRTLIIAMGAKLLAYTAWASQRQDFLPALCDEAFTLVLLILLLAIGRRRISPAIPIIALGLGATVLGGVIQHSGFGLHRHFNHNDIYHLLGGVTIWCFYLAGRMFSDRLPCRPNR